MNPRHSISAAPWSNESWNRLATVIATFEDAWNQRNELISSASSADCVSSKETSLDHKSFSIPDLSRFVPARDDHHREPILIELIKVDQEFRWRVGRPKFLEAYLEQWPELVEPDVVATLLTAEYLTRATCGSPPTPTELRTRFPDVAGSISWESIEGQACLEQQAREYGIATADSTTLSSCTISDANASQIRPGDHVGRYQIRRTIGRGGMGIVFQAYDPFLAREVALKIPHLGRMTSEVKERFLEEARAAAAIHHPCLCAVYDRGEEDGRPYLVMPLIQGQPLLDWLTAATPSPIQSAEIVLKLTNAVHALHSARIVHQDIKPQNIVIVGSAEPLLMDFGLAWRIDVNSTNRAFDGIMGTPAYMSPEQVKGAASEIDQRCDIYSLGVLMYRILTGHLPFQGSLPQVLARIPLGNAVPLRALRPEVDLELDQICQKAMSINPADRFQTAAEMAAALESYLQQNAVVTPAVSRPEITQNWPLNVGIFAGIAILAIGAVVLVTLYSRQHPSLRSAPQSLPVSLPPEQVAQTDPFLRTVRREIASGVASEPRVRELRTDLLHVLREKPGTTDAFEAARLVAQLSWPVGDMSDAPNIWMRTVPKPNDPTDGSALVERCQLPAGANIMIRGRIEHIPFDASHGRASFRIWFDVRQPVSLQLFSLTPGSELHLVEHWPTPNHHGDSNTAGTIQGRNFHSIPAPLAAPENFVRFSVSRGTEGEQPVEFLLHVWQAEPSSKALEKHFRRQN